MGCKKWGIGCIPRGGRRECGGPPTRGLPRAAPRIAHPVSWRASRTCRKHAPPLSSDQSLGGARLRARMAPAQSPRGRTRAAPRRAHPVSSRASRTWILEGGTSQRYNLYNLQAHPRYNLYKLHIHIHMHIYVQAISLCTVHTTVYPLEVGREQLRE